MTRPAFFWWRHSPSWIWPIEPDFTVTLVIKFFNFISAFCLVDLLSFCESVAAQKFLFIMLHHTYNLKSWQSILLDRFNSFEKAKEDSFENTLISRVSAEKLKFFYSVGRCDYKIISKIYCRHYGISFLIEAMIWHLRNILNTGDRREGSPTLLWFQEVMEKKAWQRFSIQNTLFYKHNIEGTRSNVPSKTMNNLEAERRIHSNLMSPVY